MVSCGFEVVLSASEVLPDGSGGVISAGFVVCPTVVVAVVSVRVALVAVVSARVALVAVVSARVALVAVVSARVALVAVVSARVALEVCKTVASDVVCAVLPVMRELEVTEVSDDKNILSASGYSADEQAQSRTEPLSNARIKIADNIRFFEKIGFM